MPVTGKLSLKFYEKLGDEVTNELVTWLNEVDATYRADLKELNEANFARFDAKLEQRLAEFRRDLTGEFGSQFSELRNQMAELKNQVAGVQAELIKWTFLFWLGTIGIVLLLLRFPPAS